MPNKEMIIKRPLWFGFSLAPLSVPLAYILWALLFWTDPTPKQGFSGFNSYAVSAWGFFMFAITLLSYITSAVLGVPLIAILKKVNKVSFWWVVLLAIPLGAIALVGGLFLLLAFGAEIKGSIYLELLRFSLVGSAVGFMVATSFCALVGITMPFTGRTKAARL